MKPELKCVDKEKLFAYAHRLLGAREEESVRAHVAACEACGKIAGEYQRLDSLLDEWKSAEPSSWFDSRVRAALGQAASERSVRAFGVRWTQILAPACLVLILVGVSVVLPRLHRTPPALTAPSAPVVQPATVNSAVVPGGEEPVPSDASAADAELTMYRNLPVLEDYDVLADFDVLSELPKGDKKVAN